jgi:hypothetical protein
MRHLLKKLFFTTFLLAVVMAVFLIPAQNVAAAALDVSTGNTQTISWAIGPVKPGESGSKAVIVRNTSGYSGSVTIWLSNITGTEGTPDFFGFTPTPGGDLKDELELDLAGAGLTANFALPSPVIDFPQSDTDTKILEIISLAAGTAVTLNWYWNLPYAVGNEAQGDGLTFDINYGLTQDIPPYYPPAVITPSTPNPTPTPPAATEVETTPTPTTIPPGGVVAGINTRDIQLKVLQASAHSLVTEDGLLKERLEAVSPDRSISLTLEKGTTISLVDENSAATPDLPAVRIVPDEIVVSLASADSVKPFPEGWVPVSQVFEIDSVADGFSYGMTTDLPATLLIQYGETLLPATVDDLALFYYDAKAGWVRLALANSLDGTTTASAYVKYFSQFVVLAKPGIVAVTPANIVIKKMTIDPVQIMIGESSEVRVRVTNVGGQPGESKIELTINGKLLKEQTVFLQAGETTELNTVILPGIEGTYTISIGSYTGTLVVESRSVETARQDYWWILLLALGGSILILLALGWRLMNLTNK